MECSVSPELVRELPDVMDLDLEAQKRLDSWNPIDVPGEPFGGGLSLYSEELSTSYGTKIGGHPHWVQDPEVPTCEHGHEMSFLLALSDAEFDAASRRRWCPIEDRDLIKDPYRLEEVRSAAFPYLSGLQNLFVCRQCPDWPIASVYQR